MKNVLVIFAFLLMGIITAIYIGFGLEPAQEPVATDNELTGLNEKYTLLFSHVVAENTPKGAAASYFAKRVRELSNGWIEVHVFPNGMLYEAQDEFEALKNNDVHIIAPALSEITVHDPKWLVMDLPFIFEDESMVEQAFDGRIGQLLFESLEETKGYKGITFWDNGFKQVTNNRLSIRDPEDFTDLVFRVMPSNVLMDTYRMLGARPRVYSFNEVYDLLSEGRIDGTENTLSNVYSKGFYQQQEHMTITNHNYLGYGVLMNQEFWNTLPINHQESIEQAMAEATQWLREHATEINQEMLERIELSGVTRIYKLTDRERERWKRELQPIYEKYEPIIGKEIMFEIDRLYEE